MSCTYQTVDHLQVQVYGTREEMGEAAAAQAAEYLRGLGEERQAINILFAAAPSQHEFLKSLLGEPGIPWEKVTAMQLDDYIGIDPAAPQRFSNFLARELFDHVPIRQRLMMDCQAPSVEDELARYAAVLADHPVDVAFIGIGENGHVAFNDPGTADFFDPRAVKAIRLEEESRIQQVNDNCFTRLEDVPETAMTVTIPAILRAARIFCIVPGAAKARAVRETLRERVCPERPSTCLRLHQGATLYLDRDSAAQLEGETGCEG